MLYPIGFKSSEPYITVPAWALRAAEVFRGKNDIRYYLNCICLMPNGNIVGTDGHTMFVYNSGFTVPENKLIRLDRKIPTKADTAEIRFYETFSILKFYSAAGQFVGEVTAEIVDGRFPCIDKVMDCENNEPFPGRVRVDPIFLGRIEKAFPVKGKNSSVVRFTGSFDPVIVEPKNSQYEGAKVFIMPMRID